MSPIAQHELGTPGRLDRERKDSYLRVRAVQQDTIAKLSSEPSINGLHGGVVLNLT
jgi:hypothetical protein